LAHYPIEAWIDQVRGCGSAESRDEMIRHAAECDQCRRLADRVWALQSTLIADRDGPVPDEVVEAAVRLFKVPPKRRRPKAHGKNGR